MKFLKYLKLKGFLSFLILHELKKRKLYGEELAKIIGRRKGGKLTPGTIYPALKMLKENKLIKLKQYGRKKVYCLTERGESELKITYNLFGNIFKGLGEKIKK